MLAVTILGNNSALPAFGRHPTAQIVQNYEQIFLLDCGEGTQMQLATYKIRTSKINHIFISHLHGDHYFGLIGLLTSMGLLGRKADLHLYAPQLLQSIIELQLNAASAHLPFHLHFHPLEEKALLYEDRSITINSFQVYHRIPCWGFIFKEVRPLRRIDPEKVREHDIPISFYENLHNGEDYIRADTRVITNDLLTQPGLIPKTYAFCADTLYNEKLVEKVNGVDLLYHETTYLDDLKEKAVSRFHSTSKEAATVAAKAGVKKLLIGHFSSKYETLEGFTTEACTVFENTEIAHEGTTFLV